MDHITLAPSDTPYHPQMYRLAKEFTERHGRPRTGYLTGEDDPRLPGLDLTRQEAATIEFHWDTCGVGFRGRSHLQSLEKHLKTAVLKMLDLAIARLPSSLSEN